MVKRDELKDSPLVWFAALEFERNRGNFLRAAQAKRELERLGISIRYRGKAAKGLRNTAKLFSTLRNFALLQFVESEGVDKKQQRAKPQECR